MKKLYILSVLFAAVLTGLLSGCSKSGSDAGSLAGGGSGTGTAGSLARFVIAGNYMYTIDNTSLHVYDISNPAATSRVNTVSVGFGIETIYPFKDKLFIGSSFGMFVYSLANPAAPSRISAVAHFTGCDPVVANDTVAYVTIRAGNLCGRGVSQLQVYDIRNIQTPSLIRTYTLSSPYGLGYSGNGLYVCDAASMLVYNIGAAINNPQQVLTVPSGNGERFYDVIPYGNTLICYLDKGVAFYDISNRLQPAFLSKLVN